MASKVDIINNALTKIGANTIININDDSEEARRVNVIFDDSLDLLLQEYPWNFAIERTSLAQLETDPTYEYTYNYQLPTDPYCLRVLDIYNENSQDIFYKIEGRKLLTNETSVYVRYIKRVTDMSELNAMFREALSYYIAAQLAFTLTGSNSLKKDLLNTYEFTFRKAKTNDAKEGRSDMFRAGPWVQAKKHRIEFGRNL
jgi:hypothetical protein